MEEAEYRRIAAAEDHHWWYRNTRALVRELLGPAIRPGMRVLDAGCGPGGNSAWLLPENEVVGVDVNPLALRLARERHPGMEVREASITALPFDDASFDLVLALTVLAHVGDDRGAIGELARVLRPGGKAFFLEPANPRLRRDHDEVVHGLRRYRLRNLEEEVRAAGLGIRRATHAYSFLLPPATALAVAHRIAPKAAPDGTSDLERTRGATAFAVMGRAERRALRRTDIPFGLSAIVVAERPEAR